MGFITHRCGRSVTVADGTGGKARRAHAADCADCRGETDALELRREESERADREREDRREAELADRLPALYASAERVLVSLGCEHVETSESGSRYYRGAGYARIRVSDHRLPITDERRDARERGSRELHVCLTTRFGAPRSAAEIEAELREALS